MRDNNQLSVIFKSLLNIYYTQGIVLTSTGEMNRYSSIVKEFAVYGRIDEYPGKTERQNNATAQN